MRPFEGFFSPLVPQPPLSTAITGARPWDGQEEKKNGHSGEEEEEKKSSEEDPNRSPPSSSSADAPAPTQLPSQHPELAPASASSFGSVPSPGRESNSRPENNREFRRRLTAAAQARAPTPRRDDRQDNGHRNQRGRRWPASRVLLCRVCACLAIVAFLGIVVVARVIMRFQSGTAPVTEIEPGGVCVPPAGDVAAPVVIPPVQGALRPNDEDGEQSAPVGTIPASTGTDVVPEVLATTSTGIDPPPPVDDVEVPEGEGEGEEACWILMHMEKGGGGAVRQVASEFWRKDGLMFDTVQWRRGDSYAADVMTSHWKLLHGGCVETLRHHDGERPCKWLTIFRHPVARLLSAYDHCREAPIDPLCPPTKSKDLAAFAERWGNFALRQFALSSVSQSAVKEWAARAGKPRGVSVWYLVKEYLTRAGVAEDVVLEGLLQPVQDLLSTQYAAVGIATELDATMRLFDKALSVKGLGWSWSLPKFQTQDEEEGFEYDVAESATFRDALANPRIAFALRLDVLLYEHALRVFQKQVAHHGIRY